jgi:hypothetical protein
MMLDQLEQRDPKVEKRLWVRLQGYSNPVVLCLRDVLSTGDLSGVSVAEEH